MNSSIFAILSLLLGLYGIFHYYNFEAEKKGKGYIEITAVITGQSNYKSPRQRRQLPPAGQISVKW
jgi:hypothetical protein